MKKRSITPAYHSLDYELDTCLKLEVEGYCEPGYPPVTNRAPEDCDPGDPGGVEDFHVYLTAPGKERLEITAYLTSDDIENIKQDMMHDFCDYDDNDAAYEAMAGK
jgi:hypothetical protein